ncbi:hypothetical protein B0J13DRAFT_564462 [Dactylonectria estremocensis]|uniref:Uncharacterized protein n=1 Tax=Dactylonectria estremocensis TaxID=1079267 RepID=A0A9P9IQQ4_9HYPO|nr:hypothetical protein B0J13DRAFT_564462 [Dactylonectria estremocensis]
MAAASPLWLFARTSFLIDTYLHSIQVLGVCIDIMSLPIETACLACVCSDCSDSPLSITGSIAGILTLATAISSFIWVYIRLFRESGHDIAQKYRMLQNRVENLEYLRSRLHKTQALDKDPFIRYRLHISLNKARDAADMANRCLISHQPASGFRSRVSFILFKERLLQDLNESLSDLGELVSDISKRLPLDTDASIKETLHIVRKETSHQVENILILVGQVLNRIQSLEESRSYHKSMGRPSQPGV